MVLLRHMLGDALRRLRLRQGRTLREVSSVARVSLGYLSEVERGQKEASSELLASICGALGAPLSQVLREVSDSFALAELQNEPVYAGPVSSAQSSLDGPPVPRNGSHDHRGPVPAAPPAARRVPVPAGVRLPIGPQRKLTVRQPGPGLLAEAEKSLDQAQLPVSAPPFGRVRDITNMVPV
jgi:transcriptional regulator with XRE-family HTH domain